MTRYGAYISTNGHSPYTIHGITGRKVSWQWGCGFDSRDEDEDWKMEETKIVDVDIRATEAAATSIFVRIVRMFPTFSWKRKSLPPRM